MKIKSWCENCKGSGIAPDVPAENCAICSIDAVSKGYMEKDLYELDPHQDLPGTVYSNPRMVEVYRGAQQDMLDAGFRKVKK